ncbi:MAG: hypothetical protein H7Y00_01945 [Fimbriimonadaceae bacterium]|nr:hypothetical protein [Chitinophagales bacterium]
MVKQFGLPSYVIWLFAGLAFVTIGILAVFEWTFGIAAFGLTAGVAAAGYWFFFRPAFVEMDIMKAGEPAMAIILKVWETGITIDHNPRIGMRLEIRTQNKVPYEVEVKHNVKKDSLKMFQTGRTLNVKIDSRDPKKVAILPK